MKNNLKGFTLIELMIVVAIIGIIAAISIPSLLRSRMSANEASASGGLRTIASAETDYNNNSVRAFAGENNGQYPNPSEGDRFINDIFSSQTSSSTPVFEGRYESGSEGDYFYINLMVTPTDLAGKEFSGLEIDLDAQNPALPPTVNCSVNVNLAGWGASDWKSTKSGTVHRWHGSTLMQQGQKSLMTLYFGKSFTPPTIINMKVLDKAGNPTNVSLTQQ